MGERCNVSVRSTWRGVEGNLMGILCGRLSRSAVEHRTESLQARRLRIVRALVAPALVLLTLASSLVLAPPVGAIQDAAGADSIGATSSGAASLEQEAGTVGELDRFYSGQPRILDFYDYSGYTYWLKYRIVQTEGQPASGDLWALAIPSSPEPATHCLNFTPPNNVASVANGTPPCSSSYFGDNVVGCDGGNVYCFRLYNLAHEDARIERTRVATGEVEVVYSSPERVQSNYLAVDAAGNVFFSGFTEDTYRSILKFTPSGDLSVVAGNPLGTGTFGGDPLDYPLNNIHGLAFDQSGNLLISQANSGHIVMVTGIGDPTPPIPDSQTFGSCTGGDVAMNLTECRSDPVNTATGAFTQEASDVTLGGSDGLRLRRWYTSADASVGVLGAGWSTILDSGLSFPTSTSATFRSESGQRLSFTKVAGTWWPDPGGRASLVASGAGYDVSTHDGRVFHFASSGLLESVRDRNNTGINITRNASSVPTAISHTSGPTVTTQFNGSRLSSLLLPDGRHVDYTVQSDRLVAVRGVDAAVTTYGYDAGGRLATVTDGEQHTQVTNVYDTVTGRVSQQTDALGHDTQFTWDADTQSSIMTDAAGGVWIDQYEGNSLKQSVDPLGNRTTYRYDQDLNLVSKSQPAPALSYPPPPTECCLADPDAWLDYLDLILLLLLSTPPEPFDRTIYMQYDARGNLLSRTAPEPLSYTEEWTYNSLNLPLTYTDGRNNTTTFMYDSRGNLLTTQRMGLPASSATYDSAGRMLTSTTPREATTTYGYDPSGNLVSVTDDLGNITTFTYDQSGRRLSRVSANGNEPGADPADHRWTWTYTEHDQVATETTPSGTTTFTYDNAHNLITTEHPDSSSTISVFNEGNELIQQTDPTGAVTQWTYDERGLLARHTTGAGNTTTYTYDLARRLTGMVEPKGNAPGGTPGEHSWTYAYDNYGNRIGVTDPTGATAVYTYDAVDRVTAVTDPLGRARSFTYDASDNQLSITEPDGATTTTTFDEYNRPTAVTDPLGNTTTSTYDHNGNLTSRTSPLGYTTTWAYDSLDQLTSAVAPKGNVAGAYPATQRTEYTYDANGNLTSVTDPTGAITTYSYNGENQQTSSTDALGETTTYAYDTRARVAEVVDPNNHSTRYAYNAAGDLTTRTDAKNHTTTYGYDDDHQQISEANALNQTRARTYDPNGRLISVLSPKGTTTAYAYDNGGRLKSVSYSDGTSGATYTRDAAGQVTSITDAGGTRSFTYDDRGRILTEEHNLTDRITYTYDLAGRATRRQYPGGADITYSYDSDGRLVSIMPNAVDTAITYAYDANGNLLTSNLPNNLQEVVTYDLANRPATIIHTQDGAVLNLFTYSRDTAGNPTRIASSLGGIEDYTYDAAGQLTDVCYAAPCLPTSAQIHYTYDPVGNRTAEGRNTGTQTYTYDNADRLTQITGSSGSTTVGHDVNGNLTSVGTTAYTYDGADRLRTATTDQSRVTYSYDAGHNRIKTDVTNLLLGATTTTHARWDLQASSPLLVTEGPRPDVTLRTHLYGANGQRIQTTVGGAAPNYYLHDAQSSVTTITNGTHNLYGNYSYEPFGAIRDFSGSLIPLTSDFTYTGAPRDTNTGLLNLHHRQLDPATGRFLTPDPYPLAVGDPDPSTYTYTNNRPTTLIDPTGLRGQAPSNDDCLAAFVGGYYDIFTLGLASRAISAIGDIFGDAPKPCDGANFVGKTLGMGGALALGGASLTSRLNPGPRYSSVAPRSVPALRQSYVDDVASITDDVAAWRKAGADPEFIAREAWANRRALGIQYKNLTPAERLAEIHTRNIQKYGDPFGPSIDWLRAQGKTWDQIIESATRTGGRDLGF